MLLLVQTLVDPNIPFDGTDNMKKQIVKRDGLRRNEKRERVHPRRCLHKHKLLTQSISLTFPLADFRPGVAPGDEWEALVAVARPCHTGEM